LERTLPPLTHIAAEYSGITVYDRASIDDAQLEGSSWKEHDGQVYVMLDCVFDQKVKVLRVSARTISMAHPTNLARPIGLAGGCGKRPCASHSHWKWHFGTWNADRPHC